MDGSNNENKHKKKGTASRLLLFHFKTIKRTGEVHSGIMLVFFMMLQIYGKVCS